MFKFAKVDAAATEPVRAHATDAGMDLAACETAIVPPNGGKVMVNTGIAVTMPADCYARVAPRSGLALKKSIDVLAGVVDCGYSDAIRVILINHGSEAFEVQIGDRIAQLIFERIYTPLRLELVDYDHVKEVNALAASRGLGGFGSTGVGGIGGFGGTMSM